MLMWQQARMDAESVARAYNLTTYPIDIDAVIDMIGLEVKYAPLTENTSGLIIKRDKYSTAEIYIDSTEPRVRQRFTAAHELGHYFDRHHVDDEEYSYLDRRGSDHYDLGEFYADEFAGALLMPEAEIARLQKDGATLVEMAAHFAVSVAAMKQRIYRIAVANSSIESAQ